MDLNIITSELKFDDYKDNSVIEFLLKRLEINSNNNLLIDSTSSRKWTKQQVLDSCLNFAYFLVNDCKVSKGDTVCFVVNNNDIHGIAMLGVLAAGAVYCSLPKDSTEYEIQQNVLTIKVNLLVGISDNFEILTKIGKQYSFVKKVLIFDELSKDVLKLMGPTIESSFKVTKPADIDLPVRTQPNDTAALVMSSGSTGTPKAIIRTNGNYLSLLAIIQHPQLQPLTPNDTFFSTAFTHFCGQRSLFSAIDGGAQLVVLGDNVTNEAIYTAVHDFGVTHIFAVPTELNFLVNNYHKYDKQYLKSLRDVLCAGAVLNDQTYDKINNLYDFDIFRNLYGLSESGGAICVYLSDRKNLPNKRTVGKAMPGFQVKIIDNQDKSLLCNSIGELCVRSPTVTPGYLGYCGNFQDLMTSDGFFKTGDLAYYDHDGYFYFVDRCKDVINFNISPVELENILLSHEWVVNAAVIGVNDEVDGEVPMGFVKLRHGSIVDEQQLTNYVNNCVNDFKQIRAGVKIINEFPLTSVGKINKAKLKHWVQQGKFS